MQTYADFGAVVTPPSGCVVTIGNFDGVHRGHRALFRRVTDYAAAHALTSAVLTFEPHPVRVLAPTLAPPLICSLAEKLRLMGDAGIDLVLAQRFDRAFAAMAPRAFVEQVLVEALGAHRVVVGYDFTFGARRAGTTDTLRALGADLGFAVDVVTAQSVGTGLVASSTKVREFVLEGRMDGAALVLGRPFSILGTVVAGQRRGRLLGFPTANLDAEAELLPRTGVYAGWLDWGGGPRPAVVNVGFNPTFGDAGGRPSVEAHVIGESGLDLYGARARLIFAERLRDERKFDGIDALKTQIAADRDAAAALLSQRPAPSP